jgi:hypothetical protein
MVIWTTNEKF